MNIIGRRLIQSSKFLHFKAQMVSSYVNELKNEPDLYQDTVSIKTKHGTAVNINSVFLDTKPTGSGEGVVVGTHGAPGSHKDFKYIYSNLDNRFIGINWPSMGYTSYDHALVDDNDERVQIVQHHVDQLNLDKIIFIGHSRGSENALKMAALNQDKCTAVILLNPICLQPHKGVKPYLVISFFAWLWKSFPLTHGVFNPFLLWIYQKIGLRAPNPESSGVCLNLMRHADFEGQLGYIDKLNKGNVKVLICYGGKDFLVEDKLPSEMANHFEDNHTIVCSSEDDSQALAEMQEKFNSGARHISLFFEKDGHFLQKTRADFVSKAIQFLMGSQEK